MATKLKAGGACPNACKEGLLAAHVSGHLQCGACGGIWMPDGEVTKVAKAIQPNSAALVSYADLAISANGIDVMSVGAPFTAQHAGMGLEIGAGSGFEAGSYAIKSVAFGVATLDRSPGMPGAMSGIGRLTAEAPSVAKENRRGRPAKRSLRKGGAGRRT